MAFVPWVSVGFAHRKCTQISDPRQMKFPVANAVTAGAAPVKGCNDGKVRDYRFVNLIPSSVREATDVRGAIVPISDDADFPYAEAKRCLERDAELTPKDFGPIDRGWPQMRWTVFR